MRPGPVRAQLAARILSVVLLGGWGGCVAEPPSVRRARQVLADASGRVGELALRCEPGDAEVWVDGVPRGSCAEVGQGMTLGPGLHRVEVKKEGFEPYLTYYEPSGVRATLSIRLREGEGR